MVQFIDEVLQLELSYDDIVLPFTVDSLGVRGRLVRLGPVVDEILSMHDYPEPVSKVLGEALSLTSMLGASLKFDGKFILQTQSNGPLDMIVADFASPGLLRGYAHFDREAVSSFRDHPLSGKSLIGDGYMAMTIDQGADMERYQGIVSLADGSLTAAAHGYFRQSEQIPTQLQLATGPLVGTGLEALPSWRTGAIMIQHLPSEGGVSPIHYPSGDVPEGYEEETPVENDDWVKARYLLETVEDHELLDPMLTPDRLLYRLFHEDGVKVFPPSSIKRHCTCSRERLMETLRNFDAKQREEMVEDGEIRASCQFCSAEYHFSPAELA